MKTNMVIRIKAFKGGRSKESIMTLTFFKEKNVFKLSLLSSQKNSTITNLKFAKSDFRAWSVIFSAV